MSEIPTPYERQANFTAYEASNPTATKSGASMDAELDAVKVASDETQSRLAEIQRDDGALKNQSVHIEALSAAVKAFMAVDDKTPRGEWAAMTVYIAGDVVEYGTGNSYIAVSEHVSAADFLTDYNAGLWVTLSQATAGGPLAPTVDLFAGDGVETDFTLTIDPLGTNNVDVRISGIAQTPGTDFTLVYVSSAPTVRFTTAPPLPPDPVGNPNNIVVRYAGLVSAVVSIPGVGSVVDETVAANAEIESNKLQFTPTGVSSVARTVQDKLRDVLSLKDFGATGSGDETSKIQAFLTACGSTKIAYLPDGDFSFTSLTIAGDMTFAGNGRLVGTATSGSKPTRANLTGAANSAARLALLDAYYTADITFSATAVISGSLSIKDCLLKKSGGSGIDIRGEVTFDNISTHALQVEASRNGYLSAAGFISSDSNSVGLFCERGGIIIAPSAIIVSPVGRGCYVLHDGTIEVNSGEIYNCGSNGLYVNHDGVIYALSATISGSTGVGVLTNYGGRINIDSATVTASTGSNITAESGGSIYAVNAQITNAGDTGAQTVMGGLINATGATITGSTSFAAYANGSGHIVLLTTTIDLSNNGGGSNQIIRAIGNGLIRSEAPGGSGKTALAAANYYPGHNTTGNGVAYVGLFSNNSAIISLGGVKAPASATKTIASGSITATDFYQIVDTEGAASTDDLDNIDINSSVDVVLIRQASDTRDVTVRHNGGGTGNIRLNTGANKVFLNRNGIIMLVKNPNTSLWIEPGYLG